MGKIRRTRTKRHIEAVKSNSNENENSVDFAPNQSELPAVFPVNNLFDIGDKNQTGKDVANIDTEPERKDEESKIKTKKDRRKIRHEKFLKKLHASKLVKEDIEKSKKRQNTVITGDLYPLTLALLDIDKLSSSKTDEKKRRNMKKESKKSSRSSEKRRQNAQLSDMERFQQVLAHPVFKANPLETIDEHVRNVIKNETDKK